MNWFVLIILCVVIFGLIKFTMLNNEAGKSRKEIQDERHTRDGKHRSDEELAIYRIQKAKEAAFRKERAK